MIRAHRTCLPHWLVDTPWLTDEEWELYVAILRFCYGRNYCARSVHWLAGWLGRKRETVIAMAKALEKAGWVLRVRDGNDVLWIINRRVLYEHELDSEGWAPQSLIDAVLADHRVRKAWRVRRRSLRAAVERAEGAVRVFRGLLPVGARQRREAEQGVRRAKEVYRQHTDPVARQQALAVPTSLHYPVFKNGWFVELSYGIFTKRFMACCGGARCSAALRRVLIYLYMFAEGRMGFFVRLTGIAKGLRHDPQTVGEWVETLVKMRKLKRKYVLAFKRFVKLSYLEENGETTVQVGSRAGDNRRVQGLVISMPHNRRESLVKMELQKLFVGAVLVDQPRRKPGV